MMADELKAKFFKELVGFESFKAQKALEEETYKSLLNQITRLDLSKPNLELEYARLRGSLDVLQSINSKREHFLEFARSRAKNS